ncbi:MAG: hypothetical protein WAW79_09265 [Steroidobacteraceae bacterium]
MRSLIFVFLLPLVVASAVAADDDKPVQQEMEAEASAKDVEKAYKPPPGYKTRTRGDKTIYCRKSAEIGSRFQVEKCFSEEQLMIELERIEAVKEQFERNRRVCSSGEICGGG